jgi:hypothetical protein
LIFIRNNQGGSIMDKELITISGNSPTLTAVDIRKQVNLIQSVMESVMKEGEHYGVIPGCGNKKTLLKSGAEKLAMTFRLGAKFEELPGSTEGDAFICYKINCELFHIPTGNIVGNGRGACNSKEKKYRTRAVYANKATDEEKAIGKEEKRSGDRGPYSVYIVPQDPWDVQNTIYKMATKRAMVAAIINATGASDIFSQDLEEMPEGTVLEGEIVAPQSTKPVVEPPKPKSETLPPSGDVISEPQRKRLYAISMGAGMTQNSFKEWLFFTFNIENSKDVTKSKYEEICKAAAEYKK